MDLFIAIIVLPTISYLIIMGVLLLSTILIPHCVAFLHIPAEGFYLSLLGVLMIVLPLIASYMAARKWFEKCVERYDLTLLGKAFHIIIVLAAVTGTLVKLILTLPFPSG